MTDRQLLELAAKAAGLELDWDVPDGASPWVITGSGDDRGPSAIWNPLEDDGDAFRLALALHIRVDPSADYMCVTETRYGWREGVSGGDRVKSMRRAIVLAAADHEHKKQRDLYATQYVHK